MKSKKMIELGSSRTTELIQAAPFGLTRKEFGRTQDVQQVFSVKRGSLYNAEKLGLVKGVLLRLKGSKSGIKLWDMASVENWIRSSMGPEKEGGK